jgi:predicted metal-binding membrane protein
MAARRWWRHPAALLWAATAALWLALLAAADLVGGDPLLHHGAAAGPVDGGRPPAAVVGGYLAMSMFMVVAMMLPAAAPALGRPELASRTPAQTRRGVGAAAREHRSARAVVLAGYVAAWLGFGALGLAGQVVVHAAVARWAWLDQRPALATAVALGVAGLYQFSPARRRCLLSCRHPHVLLDRPDRPRIGCGWSVGLRLAAVSLGCCWALMLVMFALGGLVVMAALTVTTGAEVSTERGGRLAGPVGVVLLYAAVSLAFTGLAVPPVPGPSSSGAW